MSNRLLVLSDLHIAPEGPLSNFHAGEQLATFLQGITSPSTTLVLAGDIFDFLQIDDRPDILDFASAPELLDTMFTGIARSNWGRAVFAGLRSLLACGTHVVLIPGNHDPEMNHPDSPLILTRHLDAEELAGKIVLHAEDHPFGEVVAGTVPVRVGHGHRFDPFNDIAPDALKRAILNHGSVPLPPGSRFVLDVMNPIKLDLGSETGRSRCSFIDLLKPEKECILLLLPYINWEQVAANAGATADVIRARFLRTLRNSLAPAPRLGEARAEVTGLSMEDWLANLVADAIPRDRKTGLDALLREITATVEARPPARADTLASHSGTLRRLARSILPSLADHSFFDPSALSAEDRAVIATELPSGSGLRVVVSGHTHSARYADLGDARYYINTGTWIDLMRVPSLADDAAVAEWIDRLERGEAERQTDRRTYAEVTAGGATLRYWGLND